MTTILCVGSTTVDYIFSVKSIPCEPTKVLATDFSKVSGGMAANAAIAIRRLGGSAHLWSVVGDDEHGTWLHAHLAAMSVDVSGVRTVTSKRTGVSAVLVDEHGEVLVCPYFDNIMGNALSWLPMKLLPNYDVILLDPRWPDAVETVCEAAKSLGILSVLDADVGDIEVLTRLIPLVDIPIFSKAALQAVTGQSKVELGLRKIADSYGQTVGATAGANGFYWCDGKSQHNIPAPNINAVDTLAAGDVFHGAFCLAIGEGMTMKSAAEFAVVTASMKCMKPGGITGTPNRLEVQRQMQEWNL